MLKMEHTYIIKYTWRFWRILELFMWLKHEWRTGQVTCIFLSPIWGPRSLLAWHKHAPSACSCTTKASLCTRKRRKSFDRQLRKVWCNPSVCGVLFVVRLCAGRAIQEILFFKEAGLFNVSSVLYIQGHRLDDHVLARGWDGNEKETLLDGRGMEADWRRVGGNLCLEHGPWAIILFGWDLGVCTVEAHAGAREWTGKHAA